MSDQTKKMAASNMSLAILEAIIAQMKKATKPYKDMTEFEKRDFNNAMDSLVKNQITQAVDIIVADKRVMLKAQVDQVVFKDGCKIVLKGGSTEAALELAEAQGNSVLVVITGAEKYKSEAAPKPEKDQKSLLDKAAGAEKGGKADPRTKRSGRK